MQPSDTGFGEFRFIEHGDNLQASVSQFICEHFSDQLPDLSQLVILVPAPDLIYTLRRALLNTLQQNNVAAFIGAEISPLKKWVNQNIFPVGDKPGESAADYINHHTRQLIILQALQSYPAHFSEDNLWQVATSLLHLFDELTNHQLDIQSLSEAEWLEELRRLYQLDTVNEHLTGEAKLIYTLWKAWQQQIADDQLTDQATEYCQKLTAIKNHPASDRVFIIAGADQLSANEIYFLKKIAETNPIHFFIQANAEDVNRENHPDHSLYRLIQALDFNFVKPAGQTSHNSFLHHAFNLHRPLHQRLVDCLPDEQALRLKMLAANSEEQEAALVDLQIRLWLLEGKRNLAVVTENRKLARRVRALLERAGVNLVDSVGWSLSTTSAATVIEKWLECIEQDFAATSLLDFLKSPFFTEGETENRQLENIFRFEQDIVLHENISGNLERYKKNLYLRHHKLQHWESNCYQQLDDLLCKLQNISAPLVEIYISNKILPASRHISVLLNSLTALQIDQTLAMDEAGNLILEELTHMHNACSIADPEMHWHEFRTWLAAALENHHYSPSSKASHVRLLNLKQSNSGYYEGLIIASADANQLPGPAENTPFFNNYVRHALGLPDRKQKQDELFYLFRRLLQSADNVLLSYCKEKSSEEQLPSPWLQTILDFYSVSGYASLLETGLLQLLTQEQASVLSSTNIPLPEQCQGPTPHVDSTDTPAVFSSSRHQRLINCPYQFFASDVLKLKAPEELVLELQKSEYGQKVHYILERFHLDKHAGSESFNEALARLERISKKVFQQDIEDNFLHRGWQRRWLEHCPAYLKWQFAHQTEWQFNSAESHLQAAVADTITVDGRIDRIDTNNDAKTIIDYKTSSQTPRQVDVDNGEDIQLSTYALLVDNVKRVQFLKLDDSNGKVADGASLDDDELMENAEQARQRLLTMITQINHAAPLPANGDDKTCGYCEFSGLCRQQYWKLGEKKAE